MKALNRLLGNLVDSIASKCCAPSTKHLLYDDEDSEEMKFEYMAKQQTMTNEHDEYTTSSKSNRDLLLISGYLRQINSKKIGIVSITRLCFNYYSINNDLTKQFIYLITERCCNDSNNNNDEDEYPSLDYSEDEDDSDDDALTIATNTNTYIGGLYLSQIKDRQNNNVNIHGDVYELNDSDKLSICSDEWIVKFSAICSAKNIILPPSVHNKLVNAYKRKVHIMDIMREYNAIFKLCGSDQNGWSDLCNAVVVDETNLNEHGLSHSSFYILCIFGQLQYTEDCVAFNWRLPSLPSKTGGNGVVFDQKHGLISMGGYKSNKCFHLSFDDEAYFEQDSAEWIWHKLPSMNDHRWFPSCCMMNNDRLISMNGSSEDHEPLRSMECFNFDRNEWSNLSPCNVARKYGGLYFEECDGLYLGGGDHASQSVEYYDLHKNEWFNLPNTSLPHKYCPNLWIDKEHNGSNKLLFIHCSYSSNFIEFIDLRSSVTKWNVMSTKNCSFDIDSFGLDHNQIRSIV